MPAVANTRERPAVETSPSRVGSAPIAAQQAGASDMLFWGYLLVIMIEYGAITAYLPILKVTRFSTIVSYILLAAVIARYKGEVLSYRQSKLALGLVVFTAMSMLWAVVRSYVPLQARYMFDYFGFLVISAFVVDSQKRVDQLSMVFTAIGILLVVQNLDKLGMEIRAGGFWAPYFMGDGNDFAWGLNVMLPFSLSLATSKHNKILVRLYGLAGFLVLVVGIIGTESRGATLALGAAIVVYWATVSKRKLVGVAAIVLLLGGVGVLAPDVYFSRMSSIADYSEDGSAQGRLRAWRSARRMALDYPLGVGAGSFNSAYGRFYRPDDAPTLRWMSAHSVYFKTLGEYGYPGLILLLCIILFTIRDNYWTAYLLRRCGSPPLSPQWPLLLSIGVIAYAVSAMFLGGLIYPHLFMLVGLTFGARRMAERAEAAPQPAAAAAAAVVQAGRGARAAPLGPLPVPALRRNSGRSVGGRFF